MTKRPDSQDHGRHESHTPSPGWRPWSWRPLMCLIFGYLQVADKKLDNILKEVKKMGEATTAALAELTKDLHRLADGYVALQAENAALKDALASADATKAQAVADAIAADDAVDSAAIADADAIVESLSPEPVEEPPAEG